MGFYLSYPDSGMRKYMRFGETNIVKVTQLTGSRVRILQCMFFSLCYMLYHEFNGIYNVLQERPLGAHV